MPHGSGWFIDDVELPVAPQTDERVITRTFQSETLFNFFPELTKSTASAFDYTMKGIIYPEIKVFQLDQIAKAADTTVVVLTVPPAERVFESVVYAVKKLVINRKGPLFTRYAFIEGEPEVEVKAYPYTLTLTELPGGGESQESIDGITDADEDALGVQQLNELVEITQTDLELEDFGVISMYQTLLGPIAV